MAIDPKQFELNRIMEMIKGRGYQLTSSSITEDVVKVEAEKTFTPELLSTKELEATWITNFLKSFGWAITGTLYPEDKLMIQFFKEVKV